MLDLDRLRINVTSGRYVVDPHAVADALLSHAGIMSTPPNGAEDRAAQDARPESISPGADSRTGPERQRRSA